MATIRLIAIPRACVRSCGGLLRLAAIILIATTAGTGAEKLAPATVCEVLENVPVYAGKMVAVVGRLSSNPFDGAWLSENACGSKVEPSDPNFPYAVFLDCFGQTKPLPLAGKLTLDEQVLQQKLDRLRRTTRLEYYDALVIAEPGQVVEKRSIRRRETWAVVYGRLKPAPQGSPGWFGAVRAKAQLCAAEGAKLEIEEVGSTFGTQKLRGGAK